MEFPIEFFKNTGLTFSVLVSAYTLISIFKDKPKVQIKVLDVQRRSGFIFIKLLFQNSGRKMSTAINFTAHIDKKQYTAMQVNPSYKISPKSKSVKYIEAFPLELPEGKACHFTLVYDIDNCESEKGKIVIDLINHKSIFVDFDLSDLV